MSSKKSMQKNKTNMLKLEKIIEHIYGYLEKDRYRTLLLELCIEDGVIQIARFNGIDKKESKRI